MSDATTSAGTVPTFRERLVPGPGGFAAVLLFAVMSGVVVLVSDLVAAVVTTLVVLVAGVVGVALTSPVVEVRDGELHAGRAHIPATALGDVEVLDAEGVRRAMGPGYDPRSFACLRTWTRGAVTAPVVDPGDPTPSWLVSTRRPRELAAAIDAARTR